MFLHYQVLGSAAQTGLFQLLGQDGTSFSTTTNGTSGYSLELGTASTGFSSYAYYSAVPQGASFWSQGYTIELWFNITNIPNPFTGGGRNNLIRIGSDAQNYGQAISMLYVSYPVTPRYKINFANSLNNNNLGTGNPQETTDSTVLTFGSWHHAALTRTPVGGGLCNFSWFLDGALRGTVTNTDDPTYYTDDTGQAARAWTDNRITIGKGAPGPSTESGALGLIDAVRISNRPIYTATFTPSATLSQTADTWFLAQLNNSYTPV